MPKSDVSSDSLRAVCRRREGVDGRVWRSGGLRLGWRFVAMLFGGLTNLIGEWLPSSFPNLRNAVFLIGVLSRCPGCGKSASGAGDGLLAGILLGLFLELLDDCDYDSGCNQQEFEISSILSFFYFSPKIMQTESRTNGIIRFCDECNLSLLSGKCSN